MKPPSPPYHLDPSLEAIDLGEGVTGYLPRDPERREAIYDRAARVVARLLLDREEREARERAEETAA